jgi:hypothetical protein
MAGRYIFRRKTGRLFREKEAKSCNYPGMEIASTEGKRQRKAVLF